MSHFHAEIIVPPTDDIRASVDQALSQFSKHDEELDSGAFWDFWEIGGRWAGAHREAALGNALDEFRQWIAAETITVSGLQFGKPTLQPESQRDRVDAEWSRRFPQFSGACPLFDHYQSTDADEVCLVKDIPDTLTCETFLIAHPAYRDPNKVSPEFLLHKEIWNGCVHQETSFSGSVLDGLSMYRDYSKHFSEDYLARVGLSKEWYCVTVDYHS